MHMRDIVGTLIVGASVVMLRPQGNLDLNYLTSVLNDKQISYMQSVPTYLKTLCDYLFERQIPCLDKLKTLCRGGKCIIES